MAKPSIDDRNQINDLFVTYMWAIDTGDVDTLVGCFTEDGTLESPAVGKYGGRAGIREFAERFARFKQRGFQLRHVVSNLMIDVDGDEGRAQCYLVAYVTQGGESRLLAPGRYDCRLARIDREWYFRNRLVVMDRDYELEGI